LEADNGDKNNAVTQPFKKTDETECHTHRLALNM